MSSQPLCDLLFELSNEDRLNILLELQKNPLKLSHISEKFNFTVPETARNVSRLTDSNLITKDSEGRFRLTTIGQQAIKLLPSFEFLCKNQSFLQSRILSELPAEFEAGIGALKNATLVKEVTTTIYNVEKMISEADEYILALVDQLLARAVELSVEAVQRGVELQKIVLRNAVIPPDVIKLASNPVFEQAARAKKLESRYLDKVDVTILMSEKELAILAFPNLRGEFDFMGFHSKDERVLNWSKALFSYYWRQAKR
jgi:predicted transcriptional regulator